MATIRTETTSSVATTDATTTNIYTAPNTDRAAYRFVVWARETTLAAATDSAVWVGSATHFTTFEANYVVASQSQEAKVGAASWTIEVQDDGAGLLEINVSGEASVNITWECIVERIVA